MKKVAILQSNYIPWKGYFDLINMVDEFIIYDHVQYTKNDWRNRNKIKTKDGKKWLTIPVKHDSLTQTINETSIANLNWGKKHWESIKANYSRTGFFKEYKNIFENLYLQSSDNLLSSVNIKFIHAINAILGITTRIRDDREFAIISKDRSEKLVEIIKQCNATEYITGAAAKNYLNESLFNQEGIKVMIMDYSGYKDYQQLFPPFAHDVTILDLLFNEGPEARKYMKSFVV